MLRLIGLTNSMKPRPPIAQWNIRSQASLGRRMMATGLWSFGFGRLAGAGLVLLAGCGAPPPEPIITDATRVRLAQALEAEGDSTSAANIMNSRTAQPRSGGADALRQAGVLVDAGQVDQGLVLGRAAMQANAGDPRIGIEVARMAVRAGRMIEAASIYHQLTVQFPTEADAFVGSGALQAQVGDLAGAVQRFRQALALRPADVAARNNLALALAMSGQAAAAVPMLEQLSQEAGAPPLVRGNLALAQAGDWRGPGMARPELTAHLTGTAPTGEAAPTTLHAVVPGCATLPGGAPARFPMPAAAAATVVPRTANMAAELPTADAPATLIAGACARRPAPGPAQVPFSAVSPAQPVLATMVPVMTLTAVPVAGGISPLMVGEAWTRRVPAEPVPVALRQAMDVAGLVPGPTFAAVETADAAHDPDIVSPDLIAAVWAGRAVPSSTPGITARVGAGTIGVRLGVPQNEADAVAFWGEVSRRHPALLGGLSPIYQAVDVLGQSHWRVRTGSFADHNTASEFCWRIQQAGSACVPEF